jgi:hypothetical protein
MMYKILYFKGMGEAILFFRRWVLGVCGWEWVFGHVHGNGYFFLGRCTGRTWKGTASRGISFENGNGNKKLLESYRRYTIEGLRTPSSSCVQCIETSR